MTRYFKRSLVFYIVFCVAVLFLAALVGVIGGEALPETYGIYVLLVSLVLFVMAAVIASRMAMSEYNAMISLLNDKCDARRFVEQFDTLVKRSGRLKKVKNQSTLFKTSVRSTFAVGLCSAGEKDRAFEIIQELSLVEFAPAYAANRVPVYTNLAVICASRRAEGDTERAQNAIDTANRLLEKHGGTYSAGYRDHIMRTQYILNAAAGKDIDEAREYLTEALRRAQTTRERVNLHFSLAEICKAKGDDFGQREHLEYVVQNGGTMQAKRDAQSMLDSLDRTKKN